MSAFNLRPPNPTSSTRNFRYDSSTRSKLHKATTEERRSYIESKRKEEIEESEGWLLTYSDMVTLLLTFFVLMFSFSEIDQSKFEEIKSALSGELLKKEVKKPFAEVENELKSIIEQRRLENAVNIETDPLGVQIELASSSLYDSGSADIKMVMEPVILEVGKAIQNIDLQDFIIEVEGHTDDIPIRSAKYESNWELSAHRATNVVKLLIVSGLSPYNLKASGFADSRPVAPNRDSDGNAIAANQELNRRVIIYVRRSSGFSAKQKSI